MAGVAGANDGCAGSWPVTDMKAKMNVLDVWPIHVHPQLIDLLVTVKVMTDV